MKKQDTYYMRRALALAVRGYGLVDPNPCVGAVVCLEGRIVGRGWHKLAGQAHAEVMALEQAGSDALGATLYVTLEPCNHVGKTGPCSKLILEKGIKRVVYGLSDPNKKASGGAEFLKANGVEVVSGVLKEKIERVLFFWLGFIKEKAYPKIAIVTVGIEGRLVNYSNRYLEKFFSGYLKDLSSNPDYLLLVRTTLVGGNTWANQSLDLELVSAWKLANNSYSLYKVD